MRLFATFLYSSLLMFCISCSDNNMVPEEEIEAFDCSSDGSKSINLITGVRFFDDNGSPIGQVGNPNITATNDLYIYPNPNNGIVAISKQNDIEYDLFLYPCIKDTSCAQIDYSEYDFDYSLEDLFAVDSTNIKIESGNMQLQFHSNLSSGYYKMVFYSENEDVIVENIYYDPNKSINESIDFLNGEF